MKIHLFRSSEIPTSRFGTIVEIIQKFRGPVEFIARGEDIQVDDVDINEIIPENTSGESKSLSVLSWNKLFGYCEEFRGKYNIKSNEAVVFFTDHGNERNWFSSWDPSSSLNFFIQTSGWEDLVESDSCYPVIYELATIPLYTLLADNLDEVVKAAHMEPRGCPFDMCMNKNQVECRLRTGDVCPQCREKMKNKNFDPNITRQIFSILDHVRSQVLYRERLTLTGNFSRLNVDKYNGKLCFPDLGDISVKLSPREITVYLFFLLHIKGVDFKTIPDHREEIRLIYRDFASDANLPRFNSAVLAMTCDNLETDPLSNLISTINRKIRETIYPEIAGNYLICGERAEPRYIQIDRDLVTVNGKPITLR